MEQNRYATKKKGKTEVYPFWNMVDIKNVVEWFENNNEWDGYLITMLELLLGRRIGDTVMMKWSDLEEVQQYRQIGTTNGCIGFHSNKKTKTFNKWNYAFTDQIGHHFYREEEKN